MSKIKLSKIEGKIRMEYLDLLWTSIAALETRQEVKNFFKDLLSESEAIMLARRIKVAQYLLEGKSYDEIMKIMTIGDGTIAKVHRWLVSGFGGYEVAVKKFGQVLNKREHYKPAMPYSFTWLKRKYPVHFALFNLFESLGKKK